ncbi:gliding motility-associated C-terminal domain-containing protein [Gramella sp. KN1008]|uniref:gliding motility-associated C-terminal domain-containing protein n=1 Tax=Gramella sp. KN1008 TaxID=2529298 RepID=UPI00103C297F|nr:gliding motility-associated C-terminal domain-containing protein [Gramella sp. KN1008]TBW27415.1 gliding motility-associated C-terminal domain-containing protein [Gramella sp. KN1008]
MQNFTLRFKGKIFYLLASFFLIGTLSSFGQDCATVADDDTGTAGNQQEYCYLQTIQDLINNGTSGGTNTAIFETSDTVNDTDPIDSAELLTNEVTYYVGSTTEDCDRVAVFITVKAALTPKNTITDSRDDFTLSPCVSSGFTVGELRNLFNADNLDYQIEVYDSESGTDALTDDTAELTPGESYFVGQVSTVSGNCPSTRAAVGYDPTEAPGPTADANQTFCESATVADLVANGTEPNTQAIRWYRNRNSSTPLADNVALIDGEDYFAGQVVNDRNDPFPPCETPMADRTAVVVTLTPGPDAGMDNSGIICEENVTDTFPSYDAVRNFYLSLLDPGVPSDGTFDPTIEQMVDIYNADTDGLGDFTTTYTIGEPGCEDSVQLTASVIANSDAEAGDFDDITGVCSSASMIDLTSLSNNNSAAQSGGTFSGTGVSENMFDPAIGEGTYTITYTVDDTSGDCINGTDFTEFFISVEEPNAGTDINETVCSSDLENPTDFITTLNSYLADGRDTDGVFTDDLNAIYIQYQDDLANDRLPQVYSTSYFVGEPGCSDEATIDITVNPSPDAGENGTADLSSSDAPVNLFDYLNGTPDTGGTWSPGNTDGSFDPSTGTSGNYTYSITNEYGCSDSAVVAVTVDSECTGNEAGSDNVGIVCGDEVAALFPSYDAVRNYYLSLKDSGVPADGTFDPTIEEMVDIYNADEDGLGDFTTTYTVTIDGCTDSTELTARVIAREAANAGDDVELEFCTGDEDQNLYNYIADGAQTDGTFSGYPEGIFSPSTEGNGTYTITYTVDDSTSCIIEGDSDTATFTIIVNEGDANAGENATVELASDADPVNLYDFLGGTPDEDGTWDPVGTFDPATDTPGVFTYTVTNGACSDSATVTVTIASDDCTNVVAGADNIGIICEDEVAALFPSYDAVRNYYLSLKDSGVPADGTFDPTIEEMVDIYNADADGLGDFTTTYTVTIDGCTDSAELTARVIAPEEANAGEDMALTFCTGDVDVNLYGYISAEANMDGTFNGYSEGTFSPSTEGAGTYSITYTVDDSSSCVLSGSTDTATFTITVNEGDADAGENATVELAPDADPINLFDYLGGTPDEDGTWDPAGTFDPATDTPGVFTYTVTDGACSDSATVTVTITSDPDCTDGPDAGADQTLDICQLEVQTLFPDNTSVRNFFLGLLEDGVATNGTFSPSIQEIITIYNADEDGIGDFSTTYTLTSGDCSDSAFLTASVYPADVINVGTIADQSVCVSDDALDLFTLLPDGADMTGEFDGYTDGMFDPAVEGEGSFDISYSVMDIGNCAAGEASFTITVTDAAFAGSDMDLSVCMNAGVQNLFDFLSADADTDGEFTLDGNVITDGMMDPSTFDAGDYEVLYTVTAINDCGDDTATFNITVQETPDAPDVATAVSYCAIQSPTGADLMGDDDNLTFYTDEDLSMMLTAEEELVAGTYYVTQTNDAGCESDATAIDVTISDPGTPTIDDANPSFCEYDDPTIADLNDAVDQTSNVTWYSSADGTEALSTGTALQDGVTYYASLYDVETDCDSSERLAVTVTIEDCPLLFPEGISPNGDGRNDTFDIENIEREYPNYTIEIYNRWGDVVYKGNANTPDWDGSANQSGSLGDDVLPVGVYFYLLDFNDGVTAPRKGKVYLSR